MKKRLEKLMGRRSRTGYTLDDIRRVYQKISPHFKAVHIVGTNGKGSVAHHVAHSMGQNVGLFTSPHIIAPYERIQIGGNWIAPEEFDTLHQWVEKELPLGNFFDTLFLIAALYFKDLDLAIIEAGIGAKLDATILVDPVVSVLTTVCVDHIDVIGPNVAADKAHVIRKGVPIVVGHKGAKKAVIERAFELRAPLYFIPPYVDFVDENRFIAQKVVEILGGQFKIARTPARFERFEKRGIEVLVDGAHNEEGFIHLMRKIDKNDYRFITHFTTKARKEAFEKVIGKGSEKSNKLCICGSFYHIREQLERLGLFEDFLNRL